MSGVCLQVPSQVYPLFPGVKSQVMTAITSWTANYISATPLKTRTKSQGHLLAEAMLVGFIGG
jgi:hypothetical protein